MVGSGAFNLNRENHTLTSVPIRGKSLIEVYENRRILIENHSGVTAYGPEKICIKVRNGTIEISGQCLEMLCMSKERIVIRGVIESIHLWGGQVR